MLQQKPVRLFISYSHKDERFRHQLQIHLDMLRRKNIIDVWSDRKIGAGQDFSREIDKQLDESQVILLLVSPDFLRSDYCYDKEVARAIEMHEAGTARVIPIILRPSDWHDAPFSKLLALPKDGRPITKWGNRDEAWLDVSKGIRSAVTRACSRNAVELRAWDVTN